MPPQLRSFIEVDPESPFPIQNLPYGIFSPKSQSSDEGDNSQCRVGVALGTKVVDLAVLAEAGIFDGAFDAVAAFRSPTLNAFMSLGPAAWRAARAALQAALSADGPRSLAGNASLLRACVRERSDVALHLPADIGDYTDFFSCREHATACGTMFRGAANALNPNWLCLPVAYHGRASSVVLSGAAVRRPNGQRARDPKDPSQGPVFGPSTKLDYELEVAFFVGTGTEMGEVLSIEQARDHVFGCVLLNDWSARDVQTWEYVPLGPFLSKSFCSSISPWVVPMAALEPFAAPTSGGSVQDPPPLAYLHDARYGSYDCVLEVAIQPAGAPAPPVTVSRSNMACLHWTMAQQLAHHTSGGCPLRPGDLMGSGTISAATGLPAPAAGSGGGAGGGGGGRDAVGERGTRAFLLDGDTVVLRGYCQGDGYRVGFGDCVGTVLPALDRGEFESDGVQ
ncbi:hypothetical protein JKP88DRAFT_196341 [Tribonema minus]|uniref:Fumarylacetoacetase n=1 Tax=Tribonema minus TaxID=303371 RepID=A0A835YWZ1_9STRA|nr:hypothetical protein JKP88DRAFT_196341 [Tribonema minus]